MGKNRDMALDFLNLVVSGKIDEAYAKYVDMKGKHHNAYTPSGFAALRQGMKDNEAKFPNKKFDIRRVIEEGDMVATFSRINLVPGELELGVTHWFRFAAGKIVELWDLGQQVPKEAVNQDGMF